MITDTELEALQEALQAASIPWKVYRIGARLIQAYRELQAKYADVLACISSDQDKYKAIAHEYQNRLEGQLRDAWAERDALKAEVASLEAIKALAQSQGSF